EVRHQRRLVEGGRHREQALVARVLGDGCEEIVDGRLADDGQHRADLLLRVGEVAHHQCADSAMTVLYLAASSSSPAPPDGLMTTIQPVPQQSSFTSSGFSSSVLLTRTIVPLTGAYKSLSVLTLSIVPNALPAVTESPGFTSMLTRVMSPSWS